MSCEPMIPSSGPSYRFFTLPIEQIPNFDPSKAQVLCHYDNGGLVWLTPECIAVPGCSGAENETSVSSECKNIYILKDMGPTSTIQYIYDSQTKAWVSKPPPG